MITFWICNRTSTGPIQLLVNNLLLSGVIVAEVTESRKCQMLPSLMTVRPQQDPESLCQELTGDYFKLIPPSSGLTEETLCSLCYPLKTDVP